MKTAHPRPSAVTEFFDVPVSSPEDEPSENNGPADSESSSDDFHHVGCQHVVMSLLVWLAILGYLIVLHFVFLAQAFGDGRDEQVLIFATFVLLLIYAAYLLGALWKSEVLGYLAPENVLSRGEFDLYLTRVRAAGCRLKISWTLEVWSWITRMNFDPKGGGGSVTTKQVWRTAEEE